jgi:hypothetical protein
MATLKRKTIIDAVKTRLATITVANGYRTGIGSDVKIFRMDVPRADSTGIAAAMVDIRDTSNDPLGQTAISPQNGMDWMLTLEITIYAWQGSTTADYIRNAISDVYKACGTDITWSGNAWTTTPLGDQLEVEQDAIKLGVGLVRIAINYRNSFWSGE